MASYTTRHTARRCMKSITSPRQQGRLPSFDDRIDKITLKLDIEIIEIQKESEADVLSEFMKEIARIDPDFIFTSDGKNDALKNCHVTF
jgi:hypothetical protein